MDVLQAPPSKLGGRLASGYYFYTSAPRAASSFQCAADTLYVTPWLVPHAVTLSKIGAEVVTVGGASTVHRLGIYLSDPVTGLPGTLLLDAGALAGNVLGMAELAISQLVAPGVLWVGGANQGSGTAPIVRTGNDAPPVAVPSGTTIPATGNTIVGLSRTSTTGAFPGTFGTPTGFAVVATIPRVFVKVT